MKALIVDDDRVLADVVAFTLRREGFEIILAHDGKSALARWKDENPDLIILDVNLPIINGFTICQKIREQARTPIILLTVHGEEDDIVGGLNIGADDYIVKPFSPRQLVARTQAVLRRVGAVTATVHQIGDIHFDPNQHRVIAGNDETIHLTPLENRLLDYMAINAGRVLTTNSIIDNVWGPAAGDRDMLRQLIRRLRSKIEPDPANPTYIQTVPGLGYGLMLDSG